MWRTQQFFSLPRHTSRLQLTKPWLSCCTPNLTEQHHLNPRPTSRLPQHPQHLHRSRRDRGRASALGNRNQATSLHLEKGGRWTRQLLVYFYDTSPLKKVQASSISISYLNLDDTNSSPNMASLTFTELVEIIMTPSLPVILIGIILILGGPILFHLVLSSSSTYTVPPSVLLLGPDNAGKTALLTLFERGAKPSATHTSQVSHSIELNASTDSVTKASFRNHDDATGTHTKFFLVDTPGHGKLRNVAMGKLARTEKTKAVVFLVDAAALGEQETLAPTAAYLYDVLLFLQKKATSKGKDKASIPILIAANKMDLFTALPATMVKAHLETELTRIRASRSKGLLDSGVGIDDVGSEEQDGWLGEYGSEKFTFQQMGEFDIDVEVLAGSVLTEEPGADKWWWWIAQRI
ncbi:hypothetical protein Trihar35433_877 [Trichoderma harzianum]|nr:hypothetical protein Trihar35433_877 [Trichoderma harzianum]